MARDAVALVNGLIPTEHGLPDKAAVVVEGPHIAAIMSAGDTRLDGMRRHDLQGRVLLPGFIDCQCNGGGGVLFNNEPTVDGLRRIAAAHRRYGTTGFLPTLISDTREVMEAAVEAVAAAISEGVPGVLGIHFEGPFLNAERKGIHDPAKFRAPQAEDIALLSGRHPGVTLVTVAPERVPDGFLEQMSRAGVIVSAGHTAASYDTMRAAFQSGVRGVTHLFNAMTQFGSREPGAVGAALDDPLCWCGVIADGHHVHPAALRIAIAAKPVGKVMLVTDAMPPVGAERADFMLGGRLITQVDGVCKDVAGVLAGSALDMAGAVRNGVQLLGLSLAEAARMASAYPAAFLGLDGVVGRIASGQRADFAVLDEALNVRETWIGGTLYRVESEPAAGSAPTR